MAVSIGAIEVLAQVKDQLTPHMDRIGRKLDDTGAAAEKTARRTDKSFAKMQRAAKIATGALSVLALSVGRDWDAATRALAEGTGATGDALDGLEASLRKVAGTSDASLGEVASTLAGLNTHLGLTGASLEQLATKLNKAGVDADSFGSIARQMGLDAGGSATLLDQLVKVSQDTGVSVEELTLRIGRNAKAFVDAGGSMDGLVGLVADVSYEFGPQGLAGNMAEAMKTVRQGVIPAVETLDERLGDVSGTVEETYAATGGLTKLWGELRTGAKGMVGPVANVIGVLGSLGLAFTTLAPLAKAAWAATGGPVTIVIAAVVALGAVMYRFRRRIGDVFSGIIRIVATWADKFLGFIQEAVGGIPLIGDKMAESVGQAREKAAAMYEAAAQWTDGWGEVEEAVDDATVATRANTAAAAAGAAAAAEHKTRLDDMKAGLLGIVTPTAEAKEEAVLLGEAWADFTSAERSAAIEQFEGRVRGLREAGVELKGDMALLAATTREAGLATAISLPHYDGLIGRIEQIPAAAAPVPGAFTSLWDSIGGTVKSMASTVGATVGNMMIAMVNTVGSTKDRMHAAGGALASAIATGLNAIPIVGPFLGKLGPAIRQGLSALIDRAGPEMTARFERIWQTISDTGRAAFGVLKAVIEHLRPVIEGVLVAWQVAMKALQAGLKLVEGLMTAIQAVLGLVKKVVGGIASLAKGAIGLVDKLTGGVVGKVAGAVKLVVGGAIKGIGKLFGFGKSKMNEAARESARIAKENAQRWADAQKAAIDTLVGAWQSAKDAGIAAYDEVYAAAVSAGASAEEAAIAAKDAQVSAIAEVLAAEEAKHVQQAAFEAALEAIRSGNAAGAAQVAREAAYTTRTAWRTALQAVQDADAATAEAMKGSASAVTQAKIDAANAQLEAARTAAQAEVQAAHDAYGQIVAAADAMFAKAVASANASFEAVKGKAEEVYGAMVAQAEAAYQDAVAAAEKMEGAVNTAVSTHDKAQAEGVTAYEAAIKAGKSVADATEAQRQAVAALMAAERQRYIDAAAHEAALAATRDGNAAGAVAAARAAAELAKAEWEVSMEAAMAAARAAAEGAASAGQASFDDLEAAREAMRTDAKEKAEEVRDDQIAAAEEARDRIIEMAEEKRDAEIKAAEEARDAIVEWAEDQRDRAIEAAEAARDRMIAAAEAARDAQVLAAEDAANGVVAALDSIPDKEVTVTVTTRYVDEGELDDGVDTPGTDNRPDNGNVGNVGSGGGAEGFHRGSGGIRDFGGGTPARLHGREGVFTQQNIERMIAAAASGASGGSGRGGDIVLHLDGEEVGRVMMNRMAKEARMRGYA